MDRKRRNSVILGVVCVLAAVGTGIGINMAKKPGSQIVVLVDGVEQARYSLFEEQEIEIETQEGNNRLYIHDETADMKEADCPDQLCVNQKGIRMVGETIVCLPHRVVIEVEGAEQSDLDSIAN